MYLVYMISNKGKKLYIGVTKNVQKRLIEHNKGFTKSTKPYRPWKLNYKEEYNDKKEAFRKIT